jgi:FkbM family methyltransferase
MFTHHFKSLVWNSLRKAGFNYASQAEINFYQSLPACSVFYGSVDDSFKILIAPYLPFSKAQLSQDLFALTSHGSTKPAFFVEFEATDGIFLSNTWLLEKKLGWTGILAEPARSWHSSLCANRSCNIDKRCVYHSSGQKVSFQEALSPEHSAINSQLNIGDNSTYEVETVSLSDLLDAYNAPSEVQFLSIDTEGGELEILMNYDFASERRINSISVEHNYRIKERKLIYALLSSHGYKQVYHSLSKWDDWYVLKK